MNKKITILTFHFNQNYGAVLQAYALQSFLKSHGFDPTFPDYIPPYMRPSSSLLRGIRSDGKIRVGLLLQKLKSIPRRLAFFWFRRQYLNINRDSNTLEKAVELQRSSVAVIAGSDQVWNLNWHPDDSFEEYYFMGSTKVGPVKKISYAACFGKSDQPAEKLRKAGLLIRRFDAVFSRNRLTKTIAEDAADITVPLVVDPTMLPGVNWPVRSAPKKHQQYILIYSIDEGQKTMAQAIVSRLKKGTSLKVVQVCSENAHRVDGCDRYETSASPIGWLNLIHHAQFVVTDSFHGCVFSLKFGTRLVAYAEDWRAERIQDLLENVGLARCLLTQIAHLDRLDAAGFFDADMELVKSRIAEAGNASADMLMGELMC